MSYSQFKREAETKMAELLSPKIYPFTSKKYMYSFKSLSHLAATLATNPQHLRGRFQNVSECSRVSLFPCMSRDAWVRIKMRLCVFEMLKKNPTTISVIQNGQRIDFSMSNPSRFLFFNLVYASYKM